MSFSDILQVPASATSTPAGFPAGLKGTPVNDLPESLAAPQWQLSSKQLPDELWLAPHWVVALPTAQPVGPQ